MNERTLVNLRVTSHQLKMIKKAVSVYCGELAHREIRTNPNSPAGIRLCKDVNELVDVENQLDEIIKGLAQ